MSVADLRRMSGVFSPAFSVRCIYMDKIVRAWVHSCLFSIHCHLCVDKALWSWPGECKYDQNDHRSKYNKLVNRSKWVLANRGEGVEKIICLSLRQARDSLRFSFEKYYFSHFWPCCILPSRLNDPSKSSAEYLISDKKWDGNVTIQAFLKKVLKLGFVFQVREYYPKWASVNETGLVSRLVLRISYHIVFYLIRISKLLGFEHLCFVVLRCLAGHVGEQCLVFVVFWGVCSVWCIVFLPICWKLSTL